MSRTLYLAASFAITLGVTATAVRAECTDADMQVKVATLRQAMLALLARDPARAKEVAEKMQETAAKLQAAPSMEAACVAYDQMIADAK